MGRPMMSPSDDDGSSSAQVARNFVPTVSSSMSASDVIVSCYFRYLLDSIIVDVASECHRRARLGLDGDLEEEGEEEIRLSAEAKVEDHDIEEAVDIFGQTHPAVASEVIDCMNCGQRVAAGGFAPHLEECTTKLGSSSSVDDS